MSRAMARLLALELVLATISISCGTIDLGPRGGPAHTLDTDKIGTGQQAINPRNDAQYWNGQPMDYRNRR